MVSFKIEIRVAEEQDVEPLTHIINAAFAVERFFKIDDRTNVDGVRKYMTTGKFLVAEDSTGIAACIYVELHGERGYFGLLSVDPSRQKSGLGRTMVTAAEGYMRKQGCLWSDMHIVNLRAELPAFYSKLGYEITGTEPFIGQGAPDVECHFINFTKKLDPLL
jgi:N-acetylglutamate synthase-like GNAT family acetyltransferase